MTKQEANANAINMILLLEELEKKALYQIKALPNGRLGELVFDPKLSKHNNTALAFEKNMVGNQLNNLIKNNALTLREQLFASIRSMTHKYENKYLSTLNGIVVQSSDQDAQEEWLHEMDDMESTCQKQIQVQIHDAFTKAKELVSQNPDSSNDIGTSIFKMLPLYSGMANIFGGLTSNAENLIASGIDNTWKGINDAFDDVGNFIDSIF